MRAATKTPSSKLQAPSERASGAAISFQEHKEHTALDCEEIAKWLQKLASEVREGNLQEFEKFWIGAGTEEGDSRIQKYREIMVLRYLHRQDMIAKKEEAFP